MSAYLADYQDPYATSLVDNEETTIEESNPFPMECLPRILAAMVENIANLVQVNRSMVVMMALSTIAGCVSRGKVKLISQASEAPLTLFALVIAAPSEGKSGVMKPLLRPVYEIEHNLLKAHKLQHSDEIAQKRLLEQRLALAEKAAKSGEGDRTADFLAIHKALVTFEETPSPRIIYDDVTPEGLVEKMSGNGRAFIASAEGGIFQTIGGRYSNGIPNLDAILKAYDGEPLSVDRKGAEPIVIVRPLLTMGLMVQQHTWEQVKTNIDFMGRGLLHRFLIVEPLSKVGRRSFAGKKSNPQTTESYDSLIRELVETFKEGEPILPMSQAGDEVLARYSQTTEQGLREDGRFGGSALHTEWGGKLFLKALRLVGILHCAEHGKQALSEAITQQTAENAVRIAEWFAGEWLRLMPLTPVKETLAEAILEWLIQEQRERVTRTEVTRYFRNRAKAKDLHEALALLIEKGHLSQERSASGFGRPTQAYARNIWKN